MHFMSEDEKEKLIEQWMEAHGTELLRMNFLYLKDEHLAEDVTQEVFIRAYGHMNQFRGDSSVKTWLVRISINLCKDEFRKTWHKKEIFMKEKNAADEEGEAVEFQDETPAADEALVVKQRNQQLMEAVLTLSEKSKEMILLYYYQEFSIKEIAEILELSVNTVSARLQRARNQLKKKWKGVWEYET